MLNLAKNIREARVAPGSLALFWLGQAGFVFKTSHGKVIYTDPYLTDSVERISPEYGLAFKRLMPKLIAANEVDADYIISSHAHMDHLDADALPELLANPRSHFLGSPDCRESYLKAGVPEDRFAIFHEGELVTLDGFNLTGVYADHGDQAPEALGLLLDIEGIKIWQVGDSAYRPEKWQELFNVDIDILLPPINGAFGNLTEVEAARLAHEAHPRLVIPCHYWMFAQHFGNPLEYLDACKKYAPEVRPFLLTQGEGIEYSKNLF
jgi:L-ascorbate 6-phosphate lactonase